MAHDLTEGSLPGQPIMQLLKLSRPVPGFDSWYSIDFLVDRDTDFLAAISPYSHDSVRRVCTRGPVLLATLASLLCLQGNPA